MIDSIEQKESLLHLLCCEEPQNQSDLKHSLSWVSVSAVTIQVTLEAISL